MPACIPFGGALQRLHRKPEIAVVALGLLLSGHAAAAVHCVANADELSAALLAAQQSSGSDEIRVRAGHYVAPAGGWRMDAQQRGVTISGGFMDAGCQTQSLDASLTVLDGQHSARPLTIDTSFAGQQTTTSIVVSGLTIENGAGDNVGGLKISDSGPIYSGHILVERNIFLDNTASVYQQDNSAGALLAATDGSTPDAVYLIVRDNLFAGNRAHDGAAAMLFSNNAIDVTNNTVSGNQSFDTTLATRTTISTFTFGQITYSNNVFWDNNPDALAATYDLRADNPFRADLDADLFDNDLQAVLGTPGMQVGNLAVDPRFTDAAGGNFRLAPDSPLRDAGTDTPLDGLGVADLDGMARVLGTHVDIGAYELDGIFRDGFE